ncbi:M20/M25/M40 family metallo-hydrolase [Parahaliea aestuarii]|uniref:M20/M25/M40 family metallo-hydrolase n=1 Tax=Parahaliea aestuarii TaxID=1852021 RepID=A0A5C9A3N0_9GAMM|nr:M20/M25/M40 family metallo-hydrolase [Parahaliea aestuarii]TXS94380.1 M20/M25/M40 family metallo-hydrolase [Parahaliea aestuarii]
MKKSLLLAALVLSCNAAHTSASSAAANHLAEAIRLPTISHQDREQIDYAPFNAFLELLQQRYPTVHSQLQREVINQYSLLFTWPGSDPSLDPVLFDAHYDVVPIEPGTEDEWTHPPFAGEIADGFIWGRGALDDKASVIATLEGLEALLNEGFSPQRTLMFSFAHDEEIGGREGAAHIAQHLAAKDTRFAYMIGEGGMILEDDPALEGRPMAMINLAEKTYATLTLTARGAGGHSSMPTEDNAIVHLSRALATLQDNPFEPELTAPVSLMLETLGAETGGIGGFLMRNQWLGKPLILSNMAAERERQGMVRSTTAITMINAGIKENVIPQVAEAKVNFRLLPGTSTEALIERVEQLIDNPAISISSDRWKQSPPVADIDGPGYGVIRGALQDSAPTALPVPGLLMATTDTPHYRELAQDIYRFHPISVSLRQAASVHGTNERVSLQSIDQAVRISRALIMGAGAAP